jgi:hypothetical protein
MIKINTLNSFIHYLYGYSFIFLILGIVIACGKVPENDQVIIRAGKSEITGEYLNQVLEIAKTAYPANMTDSQLNQLREKVIAELMEEILIIERAREMDISVSDNDLETAVMRIKKDYPEKTFESMLLEQAIPFDLWKERLRKRIIIEKTIEADLKKNISICQADIESFHQRFPKQSISPIGDHPLKNEKVQASENNQNIKTFLINEKIEDAYPEWIKGLKERYGLYFSFDGKSDA